MDRANRIKEIIEYKQRRLDELADPNEWERITKNMECGEYKEFKQHCIDEEIIIAALREQEQSKWISAKERLPEYNDLVLALVDGKPAENVTLVGAYELAVYDPEEKEWILEMWPEWLGAKVTHWMPLPEPPKEGAEG